MSKNFARDHETCAATVDDLVKYIDVGDCEHDWLTNAELEDLHQLHRELKQIGLERDILSNARSWYAPNDVTSGRYSIQLAPRTLEYTAVGFRANCIHSTSDRQIAQEEWTVDLLFFSGCHLEYPQSPHQRQGCGQLSEGLASY